MTPTDKESWQHSWERSTDDIVNEIVSRTVAPASLGVPADAPPESTGSPSSRESDDLNNLNDDDDEQLTTDWGTRLLEGVLFEFARAATPTLILGLIIYFLIRAFSRDLQSGVRSSAAILLPAVAFSFLYFMLHGNRRRGRVTQSEPSASQHEPSFAARLAAFAFMATLGGSLMWLLALKTTAPVPEFVFSSVFFMLAWMVSGDREHRSLVYMVYIFGAILGSLAYVVVWGVPSLVLKDSTCAASNPAVHQCVAPAASSSPALAPKQR